MQTFTYSFFFKFLYKFGNIPVTLLLLTILIPAADNIDKHLIFFFPLILSLGMIYLINKHYLNNYKTIPYKIEADDEKLICSKFLFSKKIINIYFKDVTSLEGGIFDGRITGLMKIHDGKNNRTIGFYSKINNVKQLETIILSRVKKELYDRVVDKISRIEKENVKGEKR
jgi:hypothetical protein